MKASAARDPSGLERAVDVAALIFLLLVAWQLMHQVAGDVAMTTPLQTLRYTAELLASADFWPHFVTTGRAFLGALLIATVGGSIAGMLLGFHRLAGEVAEPMLVALYSIPKVVLYPDHPADIRPRSHQRNRVRRAARHRAGNDVHDECRAEHKAGARENRARARLVDVDPHAHRAAARRVSRDLHRTSHRLFGDARLAR